MSNKAWFWTALFAIWINIQCFIDPRILPIQCYINDSHESRVNTKLVIIRYENCLGGFGLQFSKSQKQPGRWPCSLCVLGCSSPTCNCSPSVVQCATWLGVVIQSEPLLPLLKVFVRPTARFHIQDPAVMWFCDMIPDSFICLKRWWA